MIIEVEMKHLDYIRNRTEGAASGDWIHVSWDRHYDQKLTVSASPMPDYSQGEETGEKLTSHLERSK